MTQSNNEKTFGVWFMAPLLDDILLLYPISDLVNEVNVS